MNVACPWCGAAVSWRQGQSVTRDACAHPFSVAGNCLTWRSDAPAGRRRNLWQLALRQLDPLSSRLSPARYLAEWRLEGYYRRTLSDAALADAWGRDYLDGLGLSKGARVLDHGCGRGRHSAILSRLGFTVSAQDVQSHPWWRELKDVTFQVVPPAAPRLPWTDRSFHLVLDVGVLHYIPASALPAVAGEVHRILDAGGCWVLLEANEQGYGAFANRRQIGRLHSLPYVRDVMAAAGFEEVDVAYEGYYAPVLPRLVNFVRTVAWPGPLDLSDRHSALAMRTPPERRALWRLRLRKSRRG